MARGLPLDASELARWRSEAEALREGARRDRAAASHSQACFRAEQAAQLAIKGLLRAVGSPAWGHDLTTLDTRATDVLGQLWPSGLRGAAQRLSLHYTASRYPDAFAEGSPSDHYGPELSEQALIDADAILDGVDKAWQTLNQEPESGEP